jgi:hypothetical protein
MIVHQEMDDERLGAAGVEYLLLTQHLGSLIDDCRPSYVQAKNAAVALLQLLQQ